MSTAKRVGVGGSGGRDPWTPVHPAQAPDLDAILAPITRMVAGLTAGLCPPAKHQPMYQGQTICKLFLN